MVMVDILTPPIAFLVVMVLMLGLLWAFGRLSFKPAPEQVASSKPFACGEEGQPIVQPDYSRVFPFAFYFTVLHVVALMASTVPAHEPRTLGIALIYVVGAVIGLFVLYRR
jgi:hypothetical protein